MCSNNKMLRKGLTGLAALPLVIFTLAALPIRIQAAVAPGCAGTACQCDTVGCGLQFNNAANNQIIAPGSTVPNPTQVRVTALIGVLFRGPVSVRLRWSAGYGSVRCLREDRRLVFEARKAANSY